MIEHADEALAAWLQTLEPAIDVTFEAADPGRPAGKRVAVSLVIRSIRERVDARDVEVRDVRDTDGIVLERQRSTRYFDVDYLCTPLGEPRAAHRVLGALVQLLVDHEQIPAKFVPDAVGGPLEVRLVTRGAVGLAAGAARPVGIVIQVVVPVRPTADTYIAPPAEELALDMAPPPPAPRQTAVATPLVGAGPGAAIDPADRRLTRVRRREMIVRPVTGDAPGDTA